MARRLLGSRRNAKALLAVTSGAISEDLRDLAVGVVGSFHRPDHTNNTTDAPSSDQLITDDVEVVKYRKAVFLRLTRISISRTSMPLVKVGVEIRVGQSRSWSRSDVSQCFLAFIHKTGNELAEVDIR